MWPLAHAVYYNPPQKKNILLSFRECLVTMFGGCVRQRRSSATSSSIDTEVSEISDLEAKLFKNFQTVPKQNQQAGDKDYKPA